MAPFRGFVLQPTYRIAGGRAVVHLWGKLEDGRTFLLRDGRAKPHFYVLQKDADAARRFCTGPLTSEGLLSLEGLPVVRVGVAKPSDTPPLRDLLHHAGIRTYEADVRFAMRYLIDRGVRGCVEIEGEARRGSGGDLGVDLVFDDPEIRPAELTPELSILSLDIETDLEARHLLSIALCGCGASEVFLITPEGTVCPSNALPFAHERDLLAALETRVRELDPDILTGWNVIDFDLAVLLRRGEELHAPLRLGRDGSASRVVPARERWSRSRAAISGRVVLDGIQLLRGAFIRMESYSLEAVSRKVLGSGKLVTGSDRGRKIQEMFRHDRARFVEYNLKDAELVLDILGELKLVELAVERSRITGLPPDRVSSSVAAFDFLYLSALSRRGVVAPSGGAIDPDGEGTGGGHVLEPAPGLYRNVLVLDFKSLYPSLIRTFQIDPLGLVRKRGGDQDAIQAPNGVAFLRPGAEGWRDETKRAILPELLDDLFPRRERAKTEGDGVASHAIKILMNSFYGVLGTPSCRFYDPRLANAITGFGRELLLWTKKRIESGGLPVLYGDTDSVFVLTGEEDPQAARALGDELVESLNSNLGAHIRAGWGVESRMEIELDDLYLRLFLPPIRHGTAGARKRYAGLIETDGGAETVFTGMEVVRRDWTELAKTAQRGLYERLFSDRPVEDYLRRLVADLRSRRHDDLLIYRKGLRKKIDEYTATTPPHVVAARKMKGKPGRVISYVMTAAGPEPAAEQKNDLDYEHYVEKQIRPVAEPVLAHLGLDFAKVIGDDTQLELF